MACREKEEGPRSCRGRSKVEPSDLPSKVHLTRHLPLLLLSAPPPFRLSACVERRVTPRYGVHAWDLPPHHTELASAAPKNRPDTVFRWFARLLLEGGVAGCLPELKGKGMLNDPPSLLTREMPTKKVRRRAG